MSNPCLLAALATVPDPRSRQGRSFPFPPIFALLVVGVLLGRRLPGAIAQLADEYGGDFALLLGFPRRRLPTTSTLSKLLPRIDVLELEAVLRNWIATRLSPDDTLVVNVDGTCVRGSAHRSAQRPGVHLLPAFAPRVQAVLAQLRVDTKTNEHKAALELLNILPSRRGGCIVTGDAMFTQTEVCQAIRDRNDDYALVVKGNQPALAVDTDAGLAFAAQAATFPPPKGACRRRNRRPAHGSREQPRRDTVELSTGRWRARRS
ncbi:Transposase DDE domain protein [Gemmata sp. SH-PL17]|uniref:ISAs1 family transposase n=1 Tax=Gemmata sp. SH-PL17 TaxID=1630693 RepID=UPI00078CC402|nr:ISAs1 family transposase [Gemmata sp. SH-PL17]AMV29377.1 Transposase DDE domain protein [Gemmata sp. SH-PL17]